MAILEVSKFYAGIGARVVPPDIAELMTQFATEAEQEGWTLRSGGAVGSDTAFSIGTQTKEIFLPWQGFNTLSSPFTPPTFDAFRLASSVHPRYHILGSPAKALLARNMHQILGWNLKTPSKFVICWTPDGCESTKTYSKKTGGTGSAIALASMNNIPVFNLKNPGRYKQALEFLIGLDIGETIW